MWCGVLLGAAWRRQLSGVGPQTRRTELRRGFERPCQPPITWRDQKARKEDSGSGGHSGHSFCNQPGVRQRVPQFPTSWASRVFLHLYNSSDLPGEAPYKLVGQLIQLRAEVEELTKLQVK